MTTNPYLEYLANQMKQKPITAQPSAAEIMANIRGRQGGVPGGGLSYPGIPAAQPTDYAGMAQGGVELAKMGKDLYDKYYAIDPALKAAQGASNVPAQMNAIKGAFGAGSGLAGAGAAPGASVAATNAAANAAAGGAQTAAGLGSSLAGMAGPAMGAVGTGMSIYDIAKNGIKNKSIGNRAMGAAGGAASGAMIGSIIPGVGTLIGGLLGGILGGL